MASEGRKKRAEVGKKRDREKGERRRLLPLAKIPH